MPSAPTLTSPLPSSWGTGLRLGEGALRWLLNKWKGPGSQLPSHGAAHGEQSMLDSARDCISQEPLDSLHSQSDLHPSALQGIAPGWAGNSLDKMGPGKD